MEIDEKVTVKDMKGKLVIRYKPKFNCKRCYGAGFLKENIRKEWILCACCRIVDEDVPTAQGLKIGTTYTRKVLTKMEWKEILVARKKYLKGVYHGNERKKYQHSKTSEEK